MPCSLPSPSLILARSAGGLSTFSCVVPLSSSARLCTCLFMLMSSNRGLMCFVTAFQLPKPMFVFAFEGELLAFIVNGDRFELLALLPRRKPRTDRTVQPPFHSAKELNLTSSRLLRFAYPIWRLAWISVSTVRGHTSTLFARNSVCGLLNKKRGHPHRWR